MEPAEGAARPSRSQSRRTSGARAPPSRAAGLAADYDALEERIERIQAEEDLARVRPDLDGNAIMELLGLAPGPLVGKAWRHLKELRLDRGPLSRDEAEAELRRWAQDNGLE